ncbi:nuclear pore protein 84/107, partial [Xylariaceae sp. FL0594]
MLGLRSQGALRMSGVEFERPEEQDDRRSQVSDAADTTSGFDDHADSFSRALDAFSTTEKAPADERADIFELVEKYYQYASGEVKNLRKHQKPTNGSTALRRLDDSSSPSQDSMDLDDADARPSGPNSADDLEHWEQEAQVWDLLRRLLPLRYSSRTTLRPNRRESSRFQSATALWEEFLRSDPAAQERKAVLECLQMSANESRTDIDELVRDYQKQAERGDIIAHGWLHTRYALKGKKSMNGWSGPLDPNSSDAGQLVDHNGSNPLVTQLDPDVITRQGRKLEPQDEYFERAIWLGCYELLRRGRSLSEIRDWCVDRNEVWRAVTMSSMPLSEAEAVDQSVSDPFSILLWRRTCFALARQGGTDDYERAVYGILSGDISSVEKVCKSWDDFVFAHYSSLLRAQFDSYLMKRTSSEGSAAVHQAFPSFNALQFHGDASSASERLISTLETNPKISAEARTPLKALQAAIISNNLTQYLHDLGVALGKRANLNAPSSLIPEIDDAAVSVHDPRFFKMSDHQGLRLATHVYLVVSRLDQLQGEDIIAPHSRRAQDTIVTTYVSILRLKNMVDLMPLYCSKLQEDQTFFTLSRNLSQVDELSEREVLLKLMHKLGLDTDKFVAYQPRSLLDQHPLPDQAVAPYGAFTVFLNGPPTLKYGRPLKPDFFGEPPDKLEAVDEALVKSLEWFLLVDGLWDEFFEAGAAIYKRFLKSFNLNAARSLSERVSCGMIFKRKTDVNISDPRDTAWFEEITQGNVSVYYEGKELTVEQIAAAKTFFELECLVRVLDTMETIASSEAMAQDPTEDLGREFWDHVGGEVKFLKNCMRPLISQWLLESVN